MSALEEGEGILLCLNFRLVSLMSLISADGKRWEPIKRDEETVVEDILEL